MVYRGGDGLASLSMKIGLVRRGYSSTGGAENYLCRLADALEAAGHAPVLFAGPGWPRDRWPAQREFVIPVNTGRSPRLISRPASPPLAPDRHCDRLFSLERVWRCDCYRAGDGVHRAWLERRARVEPSWRVAAARVEPQTPAASRAGGIAFRPGRGAERSSPTRGWCARKSLPAIWRVARPARIHVIYNGLPVRRVSTRRPGGSASAYARGVGVGGRRITPSSSRARAGGAKDSRMALEAVVAPAGEAVRPRLLVAGRGNAAVSHLKRSVPRDGGERVRFLGPVSDMAACYAAADVFVAPDPLRSLFQRVPGSPCRRPARADHDRPTVSAKSSRPDWTARSSPLAAPGAYGRRRWPRGPTPRAATRPGPDCRGQGGGVHHRGKRRADARRSARPVGQHPKSLFSPDTGVDCTAPVCGILEHASGVPARRSCPAASPIPMLDLAYPHSVAGYILENWQRVPGDRAVATPAALGGTTAALTKSLERLITICYQASMLREELRPVTFRLILAEPGRFPCDQGPPDGLHCLRFSQTRPVQPAGGAAVVPGGKLLPFAHRGVPRRKTRATPDLGCPALRAALAAEHPRRTRPTADPALGPGLQRDGAGPGHVSASARKILARAESGILIKQTMNVFESRWMSETFEPVRNSLFASHRGRAKNWARTGRRWTRCWCASFPSTPSSG